MSKTIVTGLRANNNLHLGNYLGAIKPMVKIQSQLSRSDKMYMFIPDLHSLTTPIDYSSLQGTIKQNVRMFIAGGIDPANKQTVIFRQSKIPPHSEMTWLLNCLTYFGEASRMTEFKDKSQRLGNKSVTVGLFDYPVLMASDILLYNANYIPVGEDQKQHIELSRTLARRVNKKFGQILTVPEPWEKQLEFSEQELSLRIRSLKHPENKMSKSIDDPSGTISLNDNPKDAAKKVLSSTTDSLAEINFDYDKQPGITNLLVIESTLTDTSIDAVKKKWKGISRYSELKRTVAKSVEKFLSDFQTKLSSVSDQQVESVLRKGEANAQAVAATTLSKMQKSLGLIDK